VTSVFSFFLAAEDTEKKESSGRNNVGRPCQ
jgi:hypothetical protein